MFSCEFSEIFNNTSLYRTPPVAASIGSWIRIWIVRQKMKKNLDNTPMILFRLSGGSQEIQFIMHFAYNHYLAKVDAKRWNRHKKNLLQKQLDVLLNICSKRFVKLTGKQLCWSHFLIKGDSSTGAFLWILTTFLKQPFNAPYTQESHTAVMAFILFVSLEC